MNHALNNEKKKEIAGKMKPDRSRIKLGEGSLEERRYQAERANKQMRKSGTFYIPANKKFYEPKRSQKGRESLNIPRGEKNEGNKMMEGKNENNRQ